MVTLKRPGGMGTSEQYHRQARCKHQQAVCRQCCYSLMKWSDARKIQDMRSPTLDDGLGGRAKAQGGQCEQNVDGRSQPS